MDLARRSNKKCECGRNYDLIKGVEGRIQEMVVTKDKRLVPISAILVSIKKLESFPKVRKVQFVQDKLGEIKINIVKGAEFTNDDRKEISNNIYNNFGNTLDVEIEYTDYIPLTKAGKHRFLIQKLPVELGGFNE